MKVHELLNHESKWTRGVTARDKNGESTHPRSANACQWCLLGALVKCYPKYSIREKVVNVIYDHISVSITQFNDQSKYRKVLGLVVELDI